MNVHAKLTANLHCLHNRKLLSFVSLLFVIVLFSSCIFSIFQVSHTALGASDIVISNETELRNAINSTVGPVVIALGNDITLTGPLIITANKDITLVSNNTSEFFKLIGANNQNTITVESGVLRLDGITVTHPRGAGGIGVHVSSGGTLIMSGGAISDNMSGSGSVLNRGTFSMFGGVISNNSGSGVYNDNGNFSMYGGVISGNSANLGGGVFIDYGNFLLAGGEISSNNVIGGGVYVGRGVFNMTGGVISNHMSTGVYNYGNFSMFGGMISNNSAVYGGGVYNGGYNGNFSMFGGTISSNKAEVGGGLYNQFGLLDLVNGVISNNTASRNGGGIGVYEFVDLEKVFVGDGMVFSGNSASTAHNRDSMHDSLYNSHISRNAVWTAPFTQGYNNYDISYTPGAPLYYSVTVFNSYATSTGTGSYSAEARVTINAGIRDGYDFFSWSVIEGGVTLSNNPSVTFTMPANNVAVSANWIPASSGGDSNGSTPTNPEQSAPPDNSPEPNIPSSNNPRPSTLPTGTNPEIIWAAPVVIIIGVAAIITIAIIIAFVVLFISKKRNASSNSKI